MESCGIYMRFSSESQFEISRQNQLEKISSYIKENNLTEYKIYENEEIQELLLDARERKFGKIIVVSLNRISRRPNEVLNFLEQIREFEIELISIDSVNQVINPWMTQFF